ncbi:MAG: hypothetical protein EOO77_24875 [Oxalobacteraceae bacterium]|nr:MAG: hypothetical protein EOO77_24875 [Oxalobacteraceae bacterium]
MRREITQEQAAAIYTVLVTDAGAMDRSGERYAFTRYVVDKQGDEYRFMGSLGFGGKFRNNGNHDNTPHIDCYAEDLTEARKATIQKVNAKLVELFSGA